MRRMRCDPPNCYSPTKKDRKCLLFSNAGFGQMQSTRFSRFRCFGFVACLSWLLHTQWVRAPQNTFWKEKTWIISRFRTRKLFHVSRIDGRKLGKCPLLKIGKLTKFTTKKNETLDHCEAHRIVCCTNVENRLFDFCHKMLTMMTFTMTRRRRSLYYRRVIRMI